MKREELIEHFRKLAKESAIAQRSHRRDGSYSEADYFFAQQETYTAAAEFIEESIPANSITLQLPTYAAGDPKAGEVVNEGDYVYWIRGRQSLSETVNGFVLTSQYPEVLIPFSAIDYEPDQWMIGPYYSTAAARDAAMKAAEEAASNE